MVSHFGDKIHRDRNPVATGTWEENGASWRVEVKLIGIENKKVINEVVLVSWLSISCQLTPLFVSLMQGSSMFFRPRSPKLMERWRRNPLLYILYKDPFYIKLGLMP